MGCSSTTRSNTRWGRKGTKSVAKKGVEKQTSKGKTVDKRKKRTMDNDEELPGVKKRREAAVRGDRTVASTVFEDKINEMVKRYGAKGDPMAKKKKKKKKETAKASTSAPVINMLTPRRKADEPKINMLVTRRKKA